MHGNNTRRADLKSIALDLVASMGYIRLSWGYILLYRIQDRGCIKSTRKFETSLPADSSCKPLTLSFFVGLYNSPASLRCVRSVLTWRLTSRTMRSKKVGFSLVVADKIRAYI